MITMQSNVFLYLMITLQCNAILYLMITMQLFDVHNMTCGFIINLRV